MFCIRKYVPIFFLLFFALFQGLAFAAAIGASPANLYFSKMLRDGYAESYITVSNPSDQTINVRMGTDGDVNGWITFDPNRTTLGPGGSTRIKIVAQPPLDQPNGVYKGTVFVIAEPPAAIIGTTGSVAVAVIGISTTVEVTDLQIEDFKVEKVDVPKTEECKNIGVMAWVTNTGNIKTTPRIHIDITDQQETTTLKTFDQSNTEVLPTQTVTISSQISSQLAQYGCIPPGLYKVKFQAYKGSELKFQNTYVLEIVPRGTLTVRGELLSLSAQSTATMGELVKVVGNFRNTGEIPVDAKLKTELYLGGVLTQATQGDLIEVYPGEDTELTSYVTPSFFGDYTIRGTVLYSEKTSNSKEVPVNVSPSILIYIVIAIVIVAVAFFIVRRKRR